MAAKLDYGTHASLSARRTAREITVDAIAGSSMVVSGLLLTVLLAVATEGFEHWVNEIFERPRSWVRRGAVRVVKGREAANKLRIPVYRSL